MSIKYIDCHTHPIKEYYKDNYQVIEKAYFKGVSAMLITGCDPKENLEVLNICSHFDYAFPVIGVHPNNSTGANDAKIIESQLTKDVVAIGEIGLDYHYPDTNKEVQKESFIAQIKVAQKFKLPVVVTWEILMRIYMKYLNNLAMFNLWFTHLVVIYIGLKSLTI